MQPWSPDQPAEQPPASEDQTAQAGTQPPPAPEEPTAEAGSPPPAGPGGADRSGRAGIRPRSTPTQQGSRSRIRAATAVRPAGPVSSRARTASRSTPSSRAYGSTGEAPPGTQFGEAPPGKRSRSSLAIILGIVGVLGVIIVAAVLVMGFWKPGFFVTTKLDVNKAQAGVQQILTDQTNGYGVKSADNVKCNNGQNPTVKKGDTFTCDVSVDGQHKQVTVTFQDNNGTYEVGRPK